MKNHPLLLAGLAAVLFCLPCGFAKDAATDPVPPTEKATVLDPYAVKTNPFAAWGLGIWFQGRFWTRTLSSLHVYSVVSGSPADEAGVRLGDEIRKVNGVAAEGMSLKILKKRFYDSERGEVVELELFDHVTGKTRVAELKLQSNRAWMRQDGSCELNCWGLTVRCLNLEQFRSRIFFGLRRIVRWENVPVVPAHATKKKPRIESELRPVYAMRRAVVFMWADKNLTLVERANRTIEIIEAGTVSESDDIVGRLVGEGASLILKADGTFELNETPTNDKSAVVSPSPASDPR